MAAIFMHLTCTCCCQPNWLLAWACVWTLIAFYIYMHYAHVHYTAIYVSKYFSWCQQLKMDRKCYGAHFRKKKLVFFWCSNKKKHDQFYDTFKYFVIYPPKWRSVWLKAKQARQQRQNGNKIDKLYVVRWNFKQFETWWFGHKYFSADYYNPISECLPNKLDWKSYFFIIY